VREPYRSGALMSLMQLHWFIRLRWVFVAVAAVALLIERYGAAVQRPSALFMVLGALAAVNLVWLLASRTLLRQTQSGEAPDADAVHGALVFANAQVAVDLALLTVILRYTGGTENPMALCYLFHMAIGSLLLLRWQAILQGLWVVALYGILAAGECRGWITPHYDFLPAFGSSGLAAQPAYAAAAWAVVSCGVFGTLYFTLHIAGRLDEREAQLRQADEALQGSLTAIRELQDRRARFMQTAAHQLKAPLAVIQTLSGLIRDGVATGDQASATCATIASRCREGIEQVTELLTLARVQQADPAGHRQALTDVGQVVVEACQRYSPLAENKRIAVNCHVPPDVDLHAHVQRRDLFDCVDNLIDNAVKFTEGPGSITVTVARVREDQMPVDVRHRVMPSVTFVSISVTDTGMGIDTESLGGANGKFGRGGVFDAFRRGNNALAAGIPGTGLGLSIVREVVEQAGGHIHVRSQPGEGATFTVAFPARRPTSNDAKAGSAHSGRVALETNRREDAAASPPAAEDGDHAG
jgi:signal transduction histidine kinase